MKEEREKEEKNKTIDVVWLTQKNLQAFWVENKKELFDIFFSLWNIRLRIFLNRNIKINFSINWRTCSSFLPYVNKNHTIVNKEGITFLDLVEIKISVFCLTSVRIFIA